MMRDKARGIVAKGWMLWAFIIIPLFVEDKYFNINQAKSHAYIVGAVAVICCMALCVRYSEIRIRSFTDLALVCLVCVALISGAFSRDFMTSFMGTSGWRIGGLTILTAVIIYYAVREGIDSSDRAWYPVFGFNVLVFLVGIMHCAGVDMLGTHEGIKAEQYYSFIATIGNTNWYSGYLCIIVPIALVMFLEAKSTRKLMLMLGFMILAESNVILCGCDSIYIGIGLCMVFGIPYIVRSVERMRRFAALIAVYGTELMLVTNLGIFDARLTDVGGVSGFMLRTKVAFGIAMVGMILLVGLTVMKLDDYENSRAPVVVTAVLESLMFAVIFMFVHDMVAHFDDSYGTYRGRTWKYSVWLYGDYPLGNKLIGVGPEMQWYDYRSLSNMFGRTILVSHSEPIQVLLTMGAVGFLGWMTIVVDRVRAYFSGRLWSTRKIMYFLPLAAYLGQSLVNSCQIMNFAMMITVMAILDKELNEC